jgi:hypothetical protein
MLPRLDEKGDGYAREIQMGLGNPITNLEKYRLASPISYRDELRSIPIDLNAGITDGHHGTVAVFHSLKLYDKLCDAQDSLKKDEIEKLTSGKREYFPDTVADESYGARTVLFRKQSGQTRLSVFDGDHEMIPAAAIDWLSRK